MAAATTPPNGIHRLLYVHGDCGERLAEPKFFLSGNTGIYGIDCEHFKSAAIVYAIGLPNLKKILTASLPVTVKQSYAEE